MPTARRSAAELVSLTVSLTVSITRQRPEDLTAGEKKKAIRHAPTIWATAYDRIRPYTTECAPIWYAYGIYTISEKRGFPFRRRLSPLPCAVELKIFEKGLDKLRQMCYDVFGNS